MHIVLHIYTYNTTFPHSPDGVPHHLNINTNCLLLLLLVGRSRISHSLDSFRRSLLPHLVEFAKETIFARRVGFPVPFFVVTE